MRCVKCGKELRDTAKFCTKCGAQQPVNSQPTVAVGDSPASGKSSSALDLGKNKQLVAIIAAAALVVIAITIVFVVIVPSCTSQPSPQSTTAASSQTANANQASSTAAASNASSKSTSTTSSASTTKSTTSSAASSKKTNDYVLPDSDKRLYKREELEKMDLLDLRNARCEIYARHGVGYANKELQSLFESKSWYKRTCTYDEFKASGESLNDYEEKNVKLIYQIEKERKSPYV